MNVRVLMLMLTVVGADAEARARELHWAGVLADDDGLVDGTVSAVFTVKDAGDAVVLTQTEASLVVVDGTFVVTLDVPAVDGLNLEVVVNGTALEPAAPLSTAWGRAVVADSALRADVAQRADAVGTITAPLTTAGLGSAGFSVSQVVGFPESFLDGDDGIDFVGGQTISFQNGVVAVRDGSLESSHISGSFVNADLADGAIQTADLADDGIGAADVSSLPLSKLANATLTSRHFAGNAIDVFVVNEPGCSEPLNSLQTESACTFAGSVTCVANVINGNPVNGRQGCAATNPGGTPSCFLGTSSSCPIPLAGRLVLP